MITLRQNLHPTDEAAIRRLCRSSGFFNFEEIEVAAELVRERLTKGEDSGYFFLLAEREGQVEGYACYGPILGTMHSWDLFWLAVDEVSRGHGLGRRLLAQTEELIESAGGRRIYVETSSSEKYYSTRRFYEGRGYVQEAVLTDFYAPGDHKVIYVKVMN